MGPPKRSNVSTWELVWCVCVDGGTEDPYARMSLVESSSNSLSQSENVSSIMRVNLLGFLIEHLRLRASPQAGSPPAGWDLHAKTVSSVVSISMPMSSLLLSFLSFC